MYFTPLDARGLISLSGKDAEAFLQGLVSNDVRKLAAQNPLYAALLTPQGKFLHDFFLYKRGEAILIDCEKPRLEDLLKRLKMYKLRAEVALEILPEGVVAAWQNTSPPYAPPASGEDNIQAYPDPRLPELGYRLVGKLEAIEARCVAQGWRREDFDAYDRMRLEFGVPDGSRDMLIDKTFLLEAGFEQWRGVDFNKGCYVGQEVTARSKFRGQVRKQLYQVRAETELPPPGTPVMLGETAIGEMRSHVGGVGLAILRIEEVEKNQELRAGGVAVVPNRRSTA